MQNKSTMRFAPIIGLISAFYIIFMTSHYAKAEEPTIINATAEVQINSLYAFSVTITHPDTGWSHYVDKWDIIGSNEKILGTRILYHPHGNNEAFTRSLANISIPIGESSVTIRANCSVDGPANNVFYLKLPRR